MSKLRNIIAFILNKGVLALLIFTPLAFGTVQKWSVSLLEITSFLLLAILLVKELLWPPDTHVSHFDLKTSRILRTLWISFGCIILLQLIPLPPEILKLLSPESYRLHTQLGGMSSDAWQSISINPYTTQQDLLLLCSYAAVFLVIIRHFRSRAQIQSLVSTILIMAGILITVAVLQKAFWNGRIYGLFPVDWYMANNNGYIWGPYLNRNHFAGYLEQCIPLGLAMLLHSAPSSHTLPGTPLPVRISRFLATPQMTEVVRWFLLVLIMVATLSASMSRGGMSASALSFVFFVWITRKRHSLRSRSMLLAMFAFVLSVVVIFASWEQLEQRFEELDTGHVGRLNVWKSSVGIVRDFPLIGSGLGTFETVYRRYQTLESRAVYDHAHNDYVELLTDSGSIGFVLFLTGSAVFLVALYRRWRHRRSSYAKCVAAGGLASCGAIIIHSATDFNLHIPANVLLLVVIAAFTYSILFNMSEEHAAGSPPATPLKQVSSKRFFHYAALLIMLSLLYFPVVGLLADHRFAGVATILDDPKTEVLDVLPLSEETFPSFLAALKAAQSAQALEPGRALYSWTVFDLVTRLGRWTSALEMMDIKPPAGLPGSTQSFKLAEQSLQRAIAAEPTMPDYHLALAELQESQLLDTLASEKSLARAVEAFPGSAVNRLAVARHYLAAGKKGQALEQLRLLSVNDDSYLLPDTSHKKDTLEIQPTWYKNWLYQSSLYAALDMAWCITNDPLVVKGIVPENPEAKNVLQLFLDYRRID